MIRYAGRVRTSCLFALLLFACSDPEPPAEPPQVEVEPETDDAVEDPAAPERDAPDDDEDDETSTTVRVVDLPDRPVRLTTLPTTEQEIDLGNEYALVRTRVTHPDEAIARWLEDALDAAQGYQQINGDWYGDGDVESAEVSLATRELLAVTAPEIVSYSRDESGCELFPTLYRYGDGRLEEVDLYSQLLPGFELAPAIRRACERGDDEPRVGCGDFPSVARLNVRRAGLVAYDEDCGSSAYDIPFAELDRGVLASSLLGRALLEVDGAEAVEVPRPELPEMEEAHRVTGGSLGRVLQRWWRAPAAVRAQVRFATGHEGNLSHVELVTAAPPSAAVREAFSLPPDQSHGTMRFPDVASPVAVRARTASVLRASPYGEETRMLLPEGAHLHVLRGRVGGRETAFGRPDTWAAAAINGTTVGWVAGNLVREHEGCVPSADRFVDAMPEDRRERARRTLLVADTEIVERGSRRRVALFVALTAPHNRRRVGATRIALHALGDACAVGERIAQWDLEGAYFGVRVGATEQRGGRAFLAVGLRGRPHDSASVLVVGVPDPALEVDVEDGEDEPELETGVGRGEAWAPLRIEGVTYEWRDGAFTRRP